MGRLYGGAHELSGIKALFLHGGVRSGRVGVGGCVWYGVGAGWLDGGWVGWCWGGVGVVVGW